MTASTPRIPRHRPLFESACTGDCNQGRHCTCREPADMGTTAGIEAVKDREIAATESMKHYRDYYVALVLAILSAAALAVLA